MTYPIGLHAALAPFNPVICDLRGGRGEFLHAVADRSTRHGLIVDTEPGVTLKPDRARTPDLTCHRVTATLADLYPLWLETGFDCDTFALSPIPDATWHVAPFSALAQSEAAGVIKTWRRLNSDTANAQLLTLMVALDRCSVVGEGVAAVPTAWYEHYRSEPVFRHVWFKIACGETTYIYFAKDHNIGLQTEAEGDPAHYARRVNRDRYRAGIGIRGYSSDSETTALKQWEACRRELAQRQKPVRTDYNLWLAEDGAVRVRLEEFDQLSRRFSKGDLADLFTLDKRTPAELVLQAHSRRLLLSVLEGDLWRVDPRISPQVTSLLQDQDKVRAPLYPLPPAMRLGFLDEHGSITCKRELRLDRRVICQPGRVYRMESGAATVRRIKARPNTIGEMDDWILSGKELLLYITGEDGQPYRFIDGRHLAEGVTITAQDGTNGAHFDLQTLIEHFDIPDVPDVSVTHRAQFEANCAELKKIQEFINTLN